MQQQEIPHTKFLSGLTGKIKERMIESINTRHLRDFDDIEIRDIKTSSKNNHVKICVFCRNTGHWLGDWAVPLRDFKDQKLSERYQHCLEFWMLEDLLISSRFLVLPGERD